MPFIIGQQFTAADVYIASEIGWGMMSRSLEPRPAFQQYYERCSQRPAFARFTEQDTKLAAQLQEKR